ncbi:MAG: hypothetical protein IKQ95_08535 [Synergistaceae bacterium]|nr:hypothetical protein [Synergistaceae bacterium]
MKRSRAFILTEQLMTMLLQAGFILVLCMSFYMLTTFYTQTQQIMTARNHAERVISFVDNKIRYAGLGLWRCGNSETIAASLSKINMLSWTHYASHGYKLPVSLKWGINGTNKDDMPLQSDNQAKGDVLTLLYAQRDLSAGGDYEVISAFKSATTLTPYKYSNGAYAGFVYGTAPLLDNSSKNINLLNKSSLFKLGGSEGNIKSYAVMESFGYPIHLYGSAISAGLTIRVYGVPESESTNIILPSAGELMGLDCMQMFVHGTDEGEGRQFAYRELQEGGSAWDKTYNQEKGILDIYMERDKDSNTFTLWVLATGGYDESLNNKRPETWPKDAHPTESEWGTGDYSTYSHHIVYVSRASWKLNNLEGFSW